MNASIRLFALTAVVGIVMGGATAQRQSIPIESKGAAENDLVGIELFDTGITVVNKYGSPNRVEALSIGGGAVGPQGGGAQGPAGGAGGGGDGGGTGTLSEPSIDSAGGFIGDPFGTGMYGAQERQGPATPQLDEPGTSGGQPGGSGGGGGGNVIGNSDRILYTRWVYNMPGSRYGFVLDKFMRVVQIEAVGLRDSRVRTDRGIKLLSTFAEVIRTYGAPDAYEIAGNGHIVLRYLVRNHVAFRLSKLDEKGPHCVTGIVVAAGKA